MEVWGGGSVLSAAGMLHVADLQYALEQGMFKSDLTVDWFMNVNGVLHPLYKPNGS